MSDASERYEKLLARAVKESGGPTGTSPERSEWEIVQEAILAVELARSKIRDRVSGKK